MILIVEYEDDFKDSLELCLNLLGKETKSCSNVEKCYKMLEDFTPECVLVDFSVDHIPQKEKFIKYLLEVKHIRVIVQTSFKEKVKEIYKKFPKVDVLVKPYSLDELENLLKSI